MSNLKIFFGFMMLVVVGFMLIKGVIGVQNASDKAIIKNCTVKKLVQQFLIKGEGSTLQTEIRYLVVTDKETFICENSYLNNKFNNSDLFFNLKEGSTYEFKVAGIGKSFCTDYRNILEVYEQ